MPGLTNNTTLLTAANQIIVALNELVAGGIAITLDAGDLVDAIGSLEEQFIYRAGEDEQDLATIAHLINDKIADIRDDVLSLDNKGLAQVLYELPIPSLTEAVEGLELVANCSPDVNLTCSPDVIVNTGGGEEIGTQPPSYPGEQGGDPPAGWEEPQETAYDRKCKVANHIFDGLYSVVNQFNNVNLESIIGMGTGAAVGVISLAFAAVLTGPIGWAVGVIGVVTGIILAFVSLSIDLAQLLTNMTTNKEDLICSLYNSTDAQSAITYFIQVLESGGANTAQTALIRAILIPDVTNALFFARDDVQGQAFEAELDGYEGSVDCDTCEELPVNIIEIYQGILVSGDLVNGPAVIETVFPIGWPNVPYLNVRRIGYQINMDWTFSLVQGSPDYAEMYSSKYPTPIGEHTRSWTSDINSVLQPMADRYEIQLHFSPNATYRVQISWSEH
jgi:hypothetical protein